MGGRGPQSFKKRQKEQQRKEKQQEKLARRVERKKQGDTEAGENYDLLFLDADGQPLDPQPARPSLGESRPSEPAAAPRQVEPQQ